MNISLNWLKQHIEEFDKVDPQEFGLKLTLATVEVEEIKDLAENLRNIVVAKVLEVGDHPNADKLKLVTVDAGDERIKVVCGGVNLQKGMLVALAKVGAKVRWHGEGEMIELTKTKIRGEESYGMICATEEIGLATMFPKQGEHEILDLSELKSKAGTPLSQALKLDDTIYDIDNKSLTNRPDLWGHYGMAREASAIYGLKLKDYEAPKIKGRKKIDLKVEIKDNQACPRYLAVAMTGVKIAESPSWLKQRLQAIGQKSINNIVDITNYIMYDLGQPLHAFSADKIKKGILVRPAAQGEKITTLDGEERELAEEDLVIADRDKAVALAGIMGGANSEIGEQTETVILESANFDAYGVRKTANRLGLRTEAVMRFEKSLAPEMAETALRKAVALISECCPEAKIVSEVQDEGKWNSAEKSIEINWDFINRRIGAELSREFITTTLKNLGFQIKEIKEGLKVKVPFWRATKDVNIKEDIIEEITRIYGYDNIEATMPEVAMSLTPANKTRRLERRIKDILTLNAGADEVFNYSFVSKEFLTKLGQSVSKAVELANPWTEDTCLLRQSLLPNLMRAAVENAKHFEKYNIFEVGKVFVNNGQGDNVLVESEEKLPEQKIMAGGICQKGEKQNSFWLAKGAVEALAEGLQLPFKFTEGEPADRWCHRAQYLNIEIDKQNIGYVCALHPVAQKLIDLKDKVAVWQVDLEKIAQYWPAERQFKPLPKYPSIDLDYSIIIDEKVKWSDIEKIARGSAPDIIERVGLLDVFRGGKIKAGSKSITFRVVYRSKERTLEMEEIAEKQKTLTDQLVKGLKAEVRK